MKVSNLIKFTEECYNFKLHWYQKTVLKMLDIMLNITKFKKT